MAQPKKRLPGQSNADYQAREDPNAQFLGEQSLHGGGELAYLDRAVRAAVAWFDRRRGRSPR